MIGKKPILNTALIAGEQAIQAMNMVLLAKHAAVQVVGVMSTPAKDVGK